MFPLCSQDLQKAGIGHLRWQCGKDCDGRYHRAFVEPCASCIERFRSNMQAKNRTVVHAVGTAMHIFKKFGNNATATVDKLGELAAATSRNPIVMVSGNQWQGSKSPPQYREGNLQSESVYWKTVARLKRQLTSNNTDGDDRQMDPLSAENLRYLDVYQLTATCYMDNCSFDGGHRSRYVNRWKAQLLLNTLCTYKGRVAPPPVPAVDTDGVVADDAGP